MKQLFIVLAKLMGLFMIYKVFLDAIQLGLLTSMTLEIKPLSLLIYSLLYLSLSVGSAWLLLARTDWIADKLKIQDGDKFKVPKASVILETGVKLIGLYISVYAIASFAKVIVNTNILSSCQIDIYFWKRTLLSAIQLILGLFLVLRSNRVLAWITTDKKLTK